MPVTRSQTRALEISKKQARKIARASRAICKKMKELSEISEIHEAASILVSIRDENGEK